AAAAAAEAEQKYQRLTDVQQSLKTSLREAGAGEEPQRISGAYSPTLEPETAVSTSLLTTLNEQLLQVPDGFTVIPKLKKQLERRRAALTAGEIDWAHAEALAFGSLVVEGSAIRLAGQDTERGTFSQRHLVLHDAGDGRRYAPIQNLPGARAPFELHNSPLSEFACLGFEYGYAAAAPEALVLWEAQYGDFTNGGEVIIDQFLIAGLAKWGQSSRLTLLLPHGYEGQGPEHSSARIERFLALGAEGNLRIANCTTPAQYFHLLRRQGRHAELRPLVLFTPKSLLRLPQATARLEELTTGTFRPVLDDPAGAARRDGTRHRAAGAFQPGGGLPRGAPGGAGADRGGGVQPAPSLTFPSMATASTLRARQARESVVIRFAGDSGDGMQVTGSRFTVETALAGNDLTTFPDFPAEIRAPAGTTYGVSAFQIQFGASDVMTPGDAVDVLVAMNPAALKVELKDLRVGGTILVDTGAFTERNLTKAGFAANP